MDHTVDADAPSGNRAGIRWYELRKTSGNWGVQNQGTFGPSDGLYRWMGAAAMDRDGNLAVGYSIGNGTAPNYPSIAYAGRLAGDPPNTLGQGEAMMFSGTGSQTGTGSRWGDYSMMTTDPVDDCTFWYTTEYVQTTGATPWRTRIGSFKFPTCRRRPLRLRRLHLRRLRLRRLRPPPPPPPPPPPLRRLRRPATASATAAAAAATSAATTTTTSTSSGPLPRPARARAAARSREDEDPARALLGWQRSPRPLETLAARPRGEPVTEARHDQAPELPGEAGRRPQLVIRLPLRSGVLSARRR